MFAAQMRNTAQAVNSRSDRLAGEQREDGGKEAKDGVDQTRDGGWMRGERERESVSPWQPIANDPTPRRKGWRDESMDGDDGGGRRCEGKEGGKEEQRTRRGRRRHTFG